MESCGKQSLNLKELLQCSICLGELTSPRALPCLHSFCQLCLERHIQASTEGGKVKKIHCPTCRISIPASKCSVYDFPKDFRIVKLRDALQSSRSRGHKTCDVCSESSTADVFCVDCEKSFCPECSAKHQSKPVSSAHITIGLYTGQSLDQTPCKEHGKEQAKFFCASCGVAVCVSCIFGGHGNHDLANLNETLDTKREELRGCLSHMRSQRLLLQDVMFQLTCMEGQLKGQYEEGRLKVRKRAQGIIGRVHKQEAVYLAQLDQSYQGQYDDVSRRRDQCLSYIKHFTSLQSRLESVLRVNDVEKVAKAYSDVLHDIQQVEITDRYKTQLLKPPQLAITSPDRIFSTENLGNSLSSNGDGVLNDGYDTSSIRSFPDNNLDSSTESRFENSHRVGRTTAKLLFKIGGCGKSASQLCLPYGLAFLEDESLMVAENGNSRLQVFDRLGRSVKVITMMTCIPRCIAHLADDKFAIADELGKCVKIVDIFSETMETLVSDSLAFPFGVARLPNDRLVVSDMIFENVTIISPEGERLLDFGSHGNGDMHFDNPLYLATDIHGNIFVSDSGHHEIKVFDSRGTFQFKFGGYGAEDGQLKYPKGVAVTPDGTIYVADAGNNRVVMYSRLGFYMSTLLDRDYGIERPTGLAYHPAGLLAVSMPDRHEVNVYQLVTDVDTSPVFHRICSD